MTEPRTDRERLVGQAYKDSGPLLARAGIYRYQSDPVDIHAWVLGQLDWPTGARALDVGCGPGRYLSALAEVSPAAHHVGVDLSFGMAAEAKASADALLVDALVADAQDLPFGNAMFDVVIAAHMLYHVPDAEAAVFELARVLVPDGHALVVLNANAHMSEIRQLHLDAMADLAGATYLLPARGVRALDDRDRATDPGRSLRRAALREGDARARDPGRGTGRRLREQHAVVLRAVPARRRHLGHAHGADARTRRGHHCE